jgi:hypothetical protein
METLAVPPRLVAPGWSLTARCPVAAISLLYAPRLYMPLLCTLLFALFRVSLFNLPAAISVVFARSTFYFLRSRMTGQVYRSFAPLFF